MVSARISRPAPPPAVRPRRAILWAFLAFAVGGCAAPDQAPIDAARVVSDVGLRASHLAAMPEFHADPLALPAPDRAAAADPSSAAYWRFAATAYSPAIRAARRRVLVAEATRDAAGLSGPIALSGDQMGFDSDDRATEVAATFDVLAILGLGRSRAATALADREERAAFADLEAVLWAAWQETDRRVAGIATARAAKTAIEQLLTEIGDGRARKDALLSRGRVADGDAARFDSVHTGVLRMISMLDREIADESRMLAEASGIPAADPAFAAIDGKTLDSVAGEDSPPSPDPEDLVRGLPLCRARLADYQVAEALVRAAAAEAWPEVRLGPKPVFEPGRVVPGGMLEIEIPFPGSADKKIAVALRARDGAREVYEDAVEGAISRATTARRALDLATSDKAAAVAAELAVQREYRAAHARFLTDPAMLEGWTMTVERRAEAALAKMKAIGEAARRAVDYREAVGPRAERPAKEKP